MPGQRAISTVYYQRAEPILVSRWHRIHPPLPCIILSLSLSLPIYLFFCLSLGSPDVDHQTFAQFYEAWKIVLQETDAVELPGEELDKADRATGKIQERVLAVSPHCRTNFGIHSELVLTTYRWAKFRKCICSTVFFQLFCPFNEILIYLGVGRLYCDGNCTTSVQHTFKWVFCSL